MKDKTKNITVTYGFGENSDIRASGYSISYNTSGVPEGLVFRVDENGNSLPVVIEGVFGLNHVYASLGALTLCYGLKWNMLTATQRLKNYSVPPGRMRLLKGINESFIIDDTYNSSPFACESALKTLGEVKLEGRKVAVLGDMLELGKHTEEAHKKVGKIAKENASVLITVGPRAEKIAEGALEMGMAKENIFKFQNSYEAGDFLRNFVGKNDLVLVKGSQGMRMERAVEAILLEKDKKEELLVRQDEEWKKRRL